MCTSVGACMCLHTCVSVCMNKRAGSKPHFQSKASQAAAASAFLPSGQPQGTGMQVSCTEQREVVAGAQEGSGETSAIGNPASQRLSARKPAPIFPGPRLLLLRGPHGVLWGLYCRADSPGKKLATFPELPHHTCPCRLSTQPRSRLPGHRDPQTRSTLRFCCHQAGLGMHIICTVVGGEGSGRDLGNQGPRIQARGSKRQGSAGRPGWSGRCVQPVGSVQYRALLHFWTLQCLCLRESAWAYARGCSHA